MLDNYFGKTDVAHDFTDTLNTLNFVAAMPRPLEYTDNSYSLHITLDPSQALKDSMYSFLSPEYWVRNDKNLGNRVV